MKPIRWALASCFLAAPAWPLFTGDDQYDRTQLNTERLLDHEHFLDLLAYDPFWRPQLLELAPRAYVRTTEGSISSNEFFSWRQVGVRGDFGRGSFGAYHLEQRSDLEQDFFYQSFEIQTPSIGPVAFRVLGQPTARKQESDLGAGLRFAHEKSFLQLDFRAIDLFYSQKNLDNRSDRRKQKNISLVSGTSGTAGAIELRWDLDSPLLRAYGDEGTFFGYQGSAGELRWKREEWTADIGYESRRLTLDSLTTGGRLQDFRKGVIRGGIGNERSLRKHELLTGLSVQRRRADYSDGTTANEFHQQRWESIPLLGLRWKLAKKVSLETTTTNAVIWIRGQKLAHEAKLKTSLQISFTPDAALVLNPTWDHDQLGSGSSFDGGNVQFQARLP